jgi:phospholipase D1/2
VSCHHGERLYLTAIVCSEHTKQALEALHPNIAVFRHPDHIPSGQVVESELLSSLKDFSLKSLKLANIGEDALHALYGMNNDIILYWAHHEKLCLVDGKIAFMGGLDMCFGRWDTNSHPSVDVHPTDVNLTVFPGQDYNNARIFDFEDVTKFDDNKLDRTKNARMGWSDLSMCLQGPVVEDLRAHFVQRWNFIYKEKYDVQGNQRYHPLTLEFTDIPDGYYHPDGKNVRLAAVERDLDSEDPELNSSEHSSFGGFASHASTFYDRLRDGVREGAGRFSKHGSVGRDPGFEEPTSGMEIQLVRSCTRWSNGVSTEVRGISPTELIADFPALHRQRLHRSHPQQRALHLH